MEVVGVQIEAEEAVEISERYEVSAVPLFLIMKVCRSSKGMRMFL